MRVRILPRLMVPALFAIASHAAMADAYVETLTPPEQSATVQIDTNWACLTPQVDASHRSTSRWDLTFTSGAGSQPLFPGMEFDVEHRIEYNANGAGWQTFNGVGNYQCTFNAVLGTDECSWEFSGSLIGEGDISLRHCVRNIDMGSTHANDPDPVFTLTAHQEGHVGSTGTPYVYELSNDGGALVNSLAEVRDTLCPSADLSADTYRIGNNVYLVCAGRERAYEVSIVGTACTGSDVPVADGAGSYSCVTPSIATPDHWSGSTPSMGTIQGPDAFSITAAACVGEGGVSNYIVRRSFNLDRTAVTAECRTGASAGAMATESTIFTFTARCGDGSGFSPSSATGCLPENPSNTYFVDTSDLAIGFHPNIESLCAAKGYQPGYDFGTSEYTCMDGATEMTRLTPVNCIKGTQIFDEGLRQCRTPSFTDTGENWYWNGVRYPSGQAACEAQIQDLWPNAVSTRDGWHTSSTSGVRECHARLITTTPTQYLITAIVRSVYSDAYSPNPAQYLEYGGNTYGLDPVSSLQLCIDAGAPLGIAPNEIGVIWGYVYDFRCMKANPAGTYSSAFVSIDVSSCAAGEAFSNEWPGSVCGTTNVDAENDLATNRCEGNPIDYSQTFTGAPVAGAYSIAVSAEMNFGGNGYFRHRSGDGEWISGPALAPGANSFALNATSGLGEVQIQACLTDGDANDAMRARMRNVSAALDYTGPAPSAPIVSTPEVNVPADAGWVGGSFSTNVPSIALTQARATVQPRTYDQRLSFRTNAPTFGTRYNNCEVPAGATSCTASLTNANMPLTGAGKDKIDILAGDANHNYYPLSVVAAFPVLWDYNPPVVAAPDLSIFGNVTVDVEDTDTALGPEFYVDPGSAILRLTPSGGGASIDLPSSSGSETAAGQWTFTFDGSGVADGVYDIEVRVADSMGNVGTYTVPDFTVDNTPPAVQFVQSGLLTPFAPNDVIEGFGAVKIQATDVSPVTITAFSVTPAGASPAAASATADPSIFDITVDPILWSQAGFYTFTAEATDARGNSASTSIVLEYVLPPGPVVSGLDMNVTHLQSAAIPGDYEPGLTLNGWVGLGHYKATFANATLNTLKVMTNVAGYDQRVEIDLSAIAQGVQACTILSGSQQCEIAVNYMTVDDLVERFAFPITVYDADQLLFPAGVSGGTFEFAVDSAHPLPTGAPVVDNQNARVTWSVQDPNDAAPKPIADNVNSTFGMLPTATLRAFNVSSNAVSDWTSAVSAASTSGARTYEFDVTGLPEGEYDLSLEMGDTFGNLAKTTIDGAVIDTVPPVIQFIRASDLAPLSNGDVIDGFGEVRLRYVDGTDGVMDVATLTPNGDALTGVMGADGHFSLTGIPDIAWSVAGVYTFDVTVTDRGGNATSASVSLDYQLPPAPVVTGLDMDVRSRKADNLSWHSDMPDRDGYIGGDTYLTNYPNSQVRNLRVEVETRGYDQRLEVAGTAELPGLWTCIVPAGGTLCDIPFPLVAEPDRAYTHELTARVKDELNLLYPAGVEGGSYKVAVDTHRPAVVPVTFNEEARTAQWTPLDGDSGVPDTPFAAFEMASTANIEFVDVNTGSTFTYQSVSAVADGNGNLTYAFDMAGLPEGRFDMRAIAKDSFTNQGRYEDPALVIDSTGPDIAITHLATGNPLQGETIEKFADIQVVLTEVVSPDGLIEAVVLIEGVNAYSPVLIEQSPGVYQMGPLGVFPIDGADYVLTVNAIDADGNQSEVSATFHYVTPDLVAGSVAIPATTFPVADSAGRYALYTAPLYDTSNVRVGGVQDVMVRMRSGPAQIAINGQSVSVGQSVMIPGYDFDAANGRFEAPLAGLAPGSVGDYVLEVLVPVPGAHLYLFNVRVWAPSLVITTDNSTPKVAGDLFSATVEDQAGHCALTVDMAAARASNLIDAPLCYLNTSAAAYNGMFGAKIKTGKLLLTKRFFAEHDGTLRFDAQIADDLGNTQVVASAQLAVDVNPDVTGIFALEPTSDISAVMAELNQIDTVFRDVIRQIPCVFGGDGATLLAETDPNSVVDVACIVEWTMLPAGLANTFVSAGAQIVGSVPEGTQTLAWRVTAVNAANESVVLEVSNYEITAHPVPALSLAFDYRNPEEVNPGADTAVDERLGIFGSWSLEMFPAPVTLRLEKQDGTLLSEKRINARAGRSVTPTSTILQRGTMAVKADSVPPVDEVTDLRMVAFYDDIPDTPVELSFVSWTNVKEAIVPKVSADQSQLLSTELLNVSVQLYDRSVYDNYAPRTGETWQVRLLQQITYRDAAPLTDWMPVDASGATSLPLDISDIASNRIRLVAEARWIPSSPLGNFLPRKSMNLVQVAILNGEAIDAKISSGKLTGPAPLSTVLKAAPLSLADRLSVGDVTWEVRDLQSGGAWTPMTSEYPSDDSVMYQTFTTGRYEVRAHVQNINSGAMFTTEPVEIIAFNIPDTTVEGPTLVMRYPDKATSATLTGSVDSPDPVVWQWSLDRGATWFDGGPSYTHTMPIPDGSVGYDNVYIHARARFVDAPADDPYSWSVEKRIIRFAPLRPPYVRISGPYRVELDQPHVFKGSAASPYRGMDVELLTEFELPDGTIVAGDDLVFTPVESDAVDGRINIIYRATLAGFEGYEMTAERLLSAATWVYIWPEFGLYGKPRYLFAPTTIQLYARQVGTRYALDEPQYAWTLPPEATVLQDTYPDRRVVEIIDPGDYTFTVDVADARGNTAQQWYTVSLADPPVMETSITMYKSNQYDREPLALTLRAVASGGHPGDRVSQIAFSVDGTPIASSGSFARAELMQGNHTIDLVLTTQSGYQYSASTNITVNPNTPPTCQIERAEYSSSWMYTARCNDSDGNMSGYEWFIDGVSLGPGSVRVTVSKYSNPVEPSIGLIGYDDSGDPSPQVSL